MTGLSKFKGIDRRLFGGDVKLRIDQDYKIDLARSIFPVYNSFVQYKSRFESDALFTEAIDAFSLEDLLCSDEFTKVYNGSSYWISFLKGAREHMLGLDVTRTTYYRYFREIYLREDVVRRHVDEAFREIAMNEELLKNRLERRFLDFNAALSGKRRLGTCLAFIQSHHPHPSHPILKIVGLDALLGLKAFDGYHRAFSSYMAKRGFLSCRFVNYQGGTSMVTLQ